VNQQKSLEAREMIVKRVANTLDGLPLLEVAPKLLSTNEVAKAT
jgi:hypothetical protein